MEDLHFDSAGGSFARRLREGYDGSLEHAKEWEASEGEAGEEQKAAQEEEAQNAALEEEERLERERKRAEMIRKVKKFLYDNKDALILSGQLAIVALVCVAGIKNDLVPDACCKKKKKKKKRK